MSISNIPILKPMLAVSAAPFDDEEYLFEIKWDGYRALCYTNGGIRLFSRNGNDMTGTFPELKGLKSSVGQKPVVLDGEIIVLKEGLPSFNSLQSRGRLKDKIKISNAAVKNPAIYMAFDILCYGGKGVMDNALLKRKDILNNTVTPQDHLLISDYILKNGRSFAAACAARGLEGIMAKSLQSIYLPGKRSPYWKKVRNTKEADLVICGYQLGKGSRKLGSLLLGGYYGKEIVYQGKVGTGFNQKEEQHILELLEDMILKEPFLKIPLAEKRHIIWVKPVLVCTVKYLALTKEGLLRHPVYKGLRRDKLPTECYVLKLE